MLIDAGPLVALVDRGDQFHQSCLQALSESPGPYLTTWPAMTEAMHVIYPRAAWQGQQLLWQLVHRGVIQVASPEPGAFARIGELMEKYRDVPMDFADATLVALAEERGIDRVFTLDSDFRVYRLRGRKHFKVVP